MIKEVYCSKEVSILLKENGFNEFVHHEYHDTLSKPHFHKKSHNFNGYEYAKCGTEWFSAPTHQMALKWLMDNYNLFFKPEPIMTKYGELKWVINIYNISIYYVNLNSFEHLKTTVKCNSLYDAIEKALKYSLKYLVKKG